MFAVLAHGMAAVAFWRAGLVISVFQTALVRRLTFTENTNRGEGAGRARRQSMAETQEAQL